MSNVSLINGHIDGANTCVVCGRDIPEGKQVCVICGHTNKKQTNYDRIRNMSVEEMAEAINDFDWISPPFCNCTTTDCTKWCAECVKEWLETEVNT